MFTIDNQFPWLLVIFSPSHHSPFHKTSLLSALSGLASASRSLWKWIWWRGSWGGHGRRSAAHRTTRWDSCTCAVSSLSSATHRATWHKKSRRRSSTWCCLFSTGWERDGCLHKDILLHWYTKTHLVAFFLSLFLIYLLYYNYTRSKSY